jgi:hypothetical protein
MTIPTPEPPARRARGGARTLLAALGLCLLYSLPALVYFLPLAARWTDHLPGRHADPVFNLWVLEWGAHQLRLGLPDLWNANIFYPERGALAFSDHLLAPAAQLLLLLDLRLAPNAIAGYDLLLVSSFVLAAAATCWVLRRSGCSWTAALLGGGMYAFAPMRWAHLEHIQILLAQWVPLTLWCWDRLLAELSWKRAALFLPVYLLHLAGGCYLAYMIHLPMLALLASRAASEWPRLVSWRGLRVLLAVALPAGLAGYLLFAPYLEVSRRQGLQRSPAEVALYSATLFSFLAPAESNLYAGWWHRLADPVGLDLSWDESRLFAGWLATAACAVGVVAFWRRHRSPPLRPLAPWQRATLALLLAAAALAFAAGDLRALRPGPDPVSTGPVSPAGPSWDGPALGFALALGLWLLARRRWGGNWFLRWGEIDPWERGLALAGLLCFLLSFPLAFVPLMRVVPGLASLRAPARFHVMTSLVIVYFAARGLDRLLPAARARRLAAGGALALLLAVEAAPAALPLRPLPDEPAFPAVYPYLRDLPAGAKVRALLEIPLGNPFRESLYMYYSTLHWKPLANGYSGFIPRSYLELRAAIPLLPDAPGFQLLRQRGISHLVLHTAGSHGRPLRRQLPAWEEESLHHQVELVFDRDGDRLYELLAAPR